MTPPTTATRVVVLDHTASLGGAELALARLLPALDRDRFEPHVVLFADGPLVARLAEVRVETRLVPLDAAVATTSRHELVRPTGAAGAARAVRALTRHARTLRRALRELEPDLVVANSLKSALIGGPVARSLGLPFVWHLHDRVSADYLPAPVAALVRTLVRHLPAYVVANSRATLDTVAPVPGLTADRSIPRTVVAYPGLDEAAFAVAPRPARDVPVVGLLGRLSPTKGQQIFLRAAAQVTAPARFRIIGSALFGEDEYAAALPRLVDELGLTGRVELVGWVDDPGAALRDLDLLVHASPVPEPFGQVVVEAMAAGVPVIGTAAGGVPEILDPAGTMSGGDNGDSAHRGAVRTPLGQLVPPDHPVALADAIDWALANPEAAGSLARAARVSAHDRFRIAETARAVEAAWAAAARPGTGSRQRRERPLPAR